MNHYTSDIKNINGALLRPTVINNSSGVMRTYGAWHLDGSVIQECLLVRKGKKSGEVFLDNVVLDDYKPLSQAIYGGVLFEHFGHFLLESLARVWAFTELNPDLPILWHTHKPTGNILNY